MAITKLISEYFRQHSPNARKLNISRMNRHQRGVKPAGCGLRGHDPNPRGREQPHQSGDVNNDQGYRDAEITVLSYRLLYCVKKSLRPKNYNVLVYCFR